MDDLGVGWKDLREVKPDLVYVSSQLLGSRGNPPRGSATARRSQAYGGLTHLWSYRDGDPVGGNCELPRPARRPPLRARGPRRSPAPRGDRRRCALRARAGRHRRRHARRPDHGGGARARVGRRRRQRRRAGCTVGRVPVRGQRGLVRRSASGTTTTGSRCARPWANPAWASGERWTSAAGRLAGRAELNGLVDAWTAHAVTARGRARACQEHGVPAGPMLYPYELLADGHLAQRGFLATLRPARCRPPHRRGRRRSARPTWLRCTSRPRRCSGSTPGRSVSTCSAWTPPRSSASSPTACWKWPPSRR